MKQKFIDPDTYINQDDNGTTRDVIHLTKRFTSQAHTAQLAAREYLEKFGELLEVKPEETKNLSLEPEKTLLMQTTNIDLKVKLSNLI